MGTSRFSRVAKKTYVYTYPHLFPFGQLTYCITQGFNLRPLTIDDFFDPDGTSTTVDSELDHVESVEPLD